MTNMADEDITLMLAFKRGNKEAFNKLLDKYSIPIINFIHRFTGNRHAAENLAHEVFLRVYRSGKKYEPKAKFSTWLYRIAASSSLDYKKVSKRDLCEQAGSLTCKPDGDEEVSKEIPDSKEKSVEVSAEQSEIDAKVQSALASLQTFND